MGHKYLILLGFFVMLACFSWHVGCIVSGIMATNMGGKNGLTFA